MQCVTHQCIEVALNVIHRLIRQVFALVLVISTVEYHLCVCRKSAKEDHQGPGDE